MYRVQSISLLYQYRQVADRAELHDEVYKLVGLFAVGQGDDMGVVQLLEDVYLGFEVLKQLAAQF